MLHYYKLNNTKYSNDGVDFNETQILATNISWEKTKSKVGNKVKVESPPSCFIITLPNNILSMKDDDKKTDEIESYAYNYMTKFFNKEIYHCQIWQWCQIQDEFATPEDFYKYQDDEIEDGSEYFDDDEDNGSF